MTLKTSKEGLNLIMEREGVRLQAYHDTRGLLTIGVGHLSNAYFPVHPGQIITREKALDLLAHDLGEVEEAIARAVSAPLKQSQFDALASLGFNIGCAGLGHSRVVHLFNAGSITMAANAFMDWVHPPQLRGRRESERRQFLGQKP